MAATINDVRMQLHALVDLGALPEGTDLDAVVRDLGLDRPAKDPTTMSADELVAEIRELTKSLLGYGARMPKELMLFVKDLLFLDAALATLAPDVDLLGEVTYIANYFARTHGEQITRDVGIDPRSVEVDLDGVRSSMGLTGDIERITHRDLQQRRALIRRRLGRRRE
jgi:ubiquinone biosynthesis protein